MTADYEQQGYTRLEKDGRIAYYGHGHAIDSQGKEIPDFPLDDVPLCVRASILDPGFGTAPSSLKSDEESRELSLRIAKEVCSDLGPVPPLGSRKRPAL